MSRPQKRVRQAGGVGTVVEGSKQPSCHGNQKQLSNRNVSIKHKQNTVQRRSRSVQRFRRSRRLTSLSRQQASVRPIASSPGANNRGEGGPLRGLALILGVSPLTLRCGFRGPLVPSRKDSEPALTSCCSSAAALLPVFSKTNGTHV